MRVGMGYQAWRWEWRLVSLLYILGLSFLAFIAFELIFRGSGGEEPDPGVADEHYHEGVQRHSIRPRALKQLYSH